jgi:hypothetical protein
MSQIYVPITSSTPAIPTSFETQDGDAVPALNVLLIDAFDSEEENDNGITTKGGTDAGDPPGTGTANEVSIYLTNRITSSVTTNSIIITNLITFDLGIIPGTYFLWGNVQAYNVDVPSGSSFTFSGAYRTDGATATFIAGEFANVFEEANMEDTEANLDVVGNSATLDVQGLVGEEIHWVGLMEYRRAI